MDSFFSITTVINDHYQFPCCGVKMEWKIYCHIKGNDLYKLVSSKYNTCRWDTYKISELLTQKRRDQ